MRLRAPLPSLDGVEEWVGGSPSLATLQGCPVLVHFWSISCELCKEGVPTINGWRERYPKLALVGIHMPRSEEDTHVPAVRSMIRSLCLRHPQGIDNRHAVVDAFSNEYVPAFYLFDDRHQLRHRSAGEQALRLLQQSLLRVLKEVGVETGDDG
nr:redoxin domain-containing protein [Pasteuria penetrans]